MRLELQHVSFEYRTLQRVQPAIADISLHIGENQFVAIVGPSGCGKSTLLNLIGGFLRPSAGRILADGVPVVGPGADRVMIFQKSGLFPFCSVIENVEFGLRIRGVPRNERFDKSRRALEAVHLSEFAHVYPKELSEGMKKLVEIARALVLSAPVLVFDECLSSLDALNRIQMQERIQQLYEVNRPTIVWVTHDLEEALMLADRVVVMSHRPGSIRLVRDITLRRPRTEEMRTSAAVQALRHELFESLSREGISDEVGR